MADVTITGEHYTRLLAERDRLRSMLQWCAETTWDRGDIDGGDFDDAMMEHGLLMEVEADEDFKAEWGVDTMHVLAWSELAEDQKK